MIIKDKTREVYLLNVVGAGYYAELQHSYEIDFTDNVAEAKQYLTLGGARKRGWEISGEKIGKGYTVEVYKKTERTTLELQSIMTTPQVK